MSVFRLSVLGSPQLEYAGRPLTISRRKALALLIYLAVTGEPQSREMLATLLWPEVESRRAAASLRNSLWSLKQVLDESWFVLAGESIGLKSDVDLWLDVAQFRRLLASCDSHSHRADDLCSECQGCLKDAVALYRDDFLAGFTLADCPRFDEWQFFQGQELRQELSGALQRLMQWHVGQKKVEAALPYGRRWVSLDPFHEPAQRELIRLYALADQRAAAQRQYQEYASLLQEELDIPPEAATKSLYEAIRTRRFPDSIVIPAGLSPQVPSSTSLVMASPPPFMAEQDVTAEHEIPVFVGRRRELERLHKVLDSVLSNQGQPIFVIGGAGRGKTMLVQEFSRQAQATAADLLVVSGNGKANIGIGDPYLPFREALTMLTGDVEGQWTAGLINSSHALRLWQAMAITLPALVEHAPDLIDTFVPGKALQARAATMASDGAPWLSQLAMILSNPYRENLEQKQIFSQYTAVLKAIAAQRPLLLILDDMHWLDVSSTSLLFHLSQEIGSERILILGTYRPEEIALSRSDLLHPLASIVGELKRQQGDIWFDLGQLGPEEERQFVEAYLDTLPNRFSERFREALYRHTGGHPFFTTELLHHMQEQGELRQDAHGLWVAGDMIDWETLPARVEGAIEQRINRLESELQSVLTVASVEGETFTAEILARVQQMTPRRLVQQLSHELDRRHRLVKAESLERLGEQRFSHYRFRHHLYQHYLYHNLSESEQAYLHEEVGTALEALYGDQKENVAVQLAQHFRKAGNLEKAGSYLLQAGQRSLQMSAFQEAIEHLSRGLNVLERLPASPERTMQELMAVIALGHALVSTRGYAAPAVKETYERARELCQQVGQTPQLFPVLYGFWSYYYVCGDQRTAYELAKQFLLQAKQQNDRGALMIAHRVLGTSLWVLGEMSQSLVCLEQSLALYEREQHRSLARIYGKNLAVAGPMYLSMLLSALGYPDQARERIREALSLAQETAHPFTTAASLCFAAMLYYDRREIQKGQRYAERCITICTEHKIPYFLMWATMLRGVALSEQGQYGEAIAHLRQGLASFRAMGAKAGVPYLLGHLAKAYGSSKQPEEALAAMAEALILVEQTGECDYEAELYRIQGELLLGAQGLSQKEAAVDDSPESCFLRAIEVAQRQGCKWHELRATVRLCRLRRQYGKTAEARRMLDEVYGWFTEGFETHDLLEAKQLLNDLARAE